MFYPYTTGAMFTGFFVPLFMYENMSEESQTLKYLSLLPQNPGKLPPKRDFYTYISIFKNIF